ncbi:unnamed protein product [Spodoptera littoralis]|uniref:Mitochondrial import inner membrane translocase subunit n=1 Tax=Spodoptera littoralis TaxID=7109 RepID=A0A9P0MZG0_SPOLI|nr:unnamed protein product [Spodoptera littoralis]CAH1636020.1 unnamed protein product [Spodoptera littoralis]
MNDVVNTDFIYKATLIWFSFLFSVKKGKILILCSQTDRQAHFLHFYNISYVLVHGLTDTCWDTCMGRPTNRLDSKTEVCIMNCVERFIDATTFITRRLMNTTKYRSDAPLLFQ